MPEAVPEPLRSILFPTIVPVAVYLFAVRVISSTRGITKLPETLILFPLITPDLFVSVS